MDKLILGFVLFFVKAFLKKDVDFDRLNIITETKLLMDRRRVRVTMRQRTDKEPKNQLLMTQIVYGFFGLMIASFIVFIKEKGVLIPMIFLHSYMLFMMAMTLITDFSSVMLDTADNQIILPRPVTSKTIFVARLVHILVYLLQFTVALIIFPLIAVFISFGPLVGIAAIGTIMLTVAFAVFLTYLLYALILRFSNEEKIKEIISWFQIFMTVFFAVGYQILPRLINFDALNISISIHWYSYLLPPVWMAYTLEGFYNLHFDSIHLLMLGLTLAAPAITFWVMIKFLAPSFAKKLSGMGNTGSTKPPVAGAVSKRPVSEKLSSIFAGSNTEQAGFELTWKMTSRDKAFKIQFYPSLAYLVVFAFIFVFKSGAKFWDIWHSLSSTKLFLWFVYLPMFSISSAIMLISYNENFAASWVYLASPLQKPGTIISGALKSLLAKFFAPVFLILFGFSFYIWGFSIVDDFILGFFNNVIIFLLMAHLRESYLPFSTQPSPKQSAGKFVQMILQLVIIAAVVCLHYLALMLPWAVPALIPVSAAGCFFLFRLIQNYSWQKIAS